MSLGIQLYSVRDDIGPEALPGTLARLAGYGFTHAEPYDILSDTEGLNAALDAAGLQTDTAHAKITELDRDRVLDAAERLGIGTVIVPFVAPASIAERDGVLALADAINAIVPVAADRGIRLGYHNHDFEFAQRIGERTAYDVLVDALDPAVVLELDTYWAAVGGEDVLALLPKLGDRVRYLHVKEEGTNPFDVAEAVGLAGSLELPVVEVVVHEGDVFPLIERNAAFFRGLVRA
ncbi:sugar phosphate isomerase/epimerase [Leifsonia sp. ZF2019]|uniref:sugar phosphate isomerase/epimerase family protein n=1 Tax=Leifsonia sp. ZF2019 TaxID=2781978 RepID=UPI001CBF3246|nr:sugar phosphate isomerase/epimerase [Leifsonia sp. ZF2019]UAJ80364.1 sugar phosphate isomerase/epimerase [Leifsonia sp. ZF2019]